MLQEVNLHASIINQKVFPDEMQRVRQEIEREEEMRLRRRQEQLNHGTDYFDTSIPENLLRSPPRIAQGVDDEERAR